MANLEYKEKLLETPKKGDKKIFVTHVTIRQSIFFLSLRIIVIELIASFFVIAFHSLITSEVVRNNIGSDFVIFNIPFFIVLVVLKTILLLFVIMQWLNEYYEITTNDVVYRKGVFMRHEERHKLEHIGSVNLEQGFFGELFNFGTLKLFNWTIEKDILLYLIHNPKKYQKILEALLPDADKSKEVFREHLKEEENEEL